MSDLIKTLKSSETGNDVYPNIKPDNIPSDAITSAKISDGAVTTDKLASDSVTTAKIHNGAVTTAKIEDEGVTTAKIGALAVTTAKIDTGAVTSNKLAESSVTSVKINSGAVSYDKLSNAVKDVIDGKQNKIDSAHKLDADLVDDSTSTNKFVTSAEKTKISNSATQSGDNTFSGHNTFSGYVELPADTELDGEGLLGILNDKQDKLTAGAGISIVNNVISATGGSQLYKHNIHMGFSSSAHIFFSIITNSATPYTTSTIADLLELIYQRGFDENNRSLQCSGFDSGNCMVSFGVSGDDYTVIYYNYFSSDNNGYYYSDSDTTIDIISSDIVETL